MINPRYITKQLDINEKMRGVLVDWYSYKKYLILTFLGL